MISLPILASQKMGSKKNDGLLQFFRFVVLALQKLEKRTLITRTRHMVFFNWRIQTYSFGHDDLVQFHQSQLPRYWQCIEVSAPQCTMWNWSMMRMNQSPRRWQFHFSPSEWWIFPRHPWGWTKITNWSMMDMIGWNFVVHVHLKG